MPTASSAQSTQTSTDQVWENYYHNLVQEVVGNVDPTKQAVLLAGNTLVIDLGNADPTIANNYIFEAGNVLPAWSPAYVPEGGLLSTYRTFLDNINLGGSIDPNLQAQINIATTNFNAAQTNFSTQATAAFAGFKAYKTNIDPTITFNLFIQTQFPVYAQAQASLQGAQSALQQLMITAYGAGYQVIADARAACSSLTGAASIMGQNSYNMAITTGENAPAGSGPAVLPGSTPAAPASSTVGSFAPAFSLDGFAAAYAQWQSNSINNVVAQTIKLTSEANAGQWSDYGWAASGGGGFGDFFFFSEGGGSSASSNTQTVNTQSSDFSIEVSYTGLQSFGITPGRWYDGGIVETYKNQLLPTAPQFFGEAGSMGLLPTELIIGFEPKIVMTLENSDYNSFKNQYQSETTSSVNIGPFCIGSSSSSTYGSTTDISYDDSKSAITIGPVKSTLPILVGVVSTKL